MDDATALSERIARRELSCAELMAATLERIERVNPGLNAIVSLREPEVLLAEAAERDAELARGERRGWMHGLPHAIKDLEETAGIVTTSGSPLFADFVPEADSEVVRRIRGAGAIVIGKTNVPEFGYGSQTYNDVFGPTRNPYDASKTAGGSSGGAAAALAAGLVPVADGSDYMGSLRNPAAFCNVYGFRPSIGRVAVAAVRVGVRGGDRHRRPDGALAARPRRAARDAGRAAPRRAVLDRRGPGGASPRRSSRPTRRGSGSAGSATSAATCRSRTGSSSSARRRWRGSGRRSTRSSRASTPPRRGRPRSRSATTTPPGCSSSRASGSSPSCTTRPTAPARSPARRCTPPSGRARRSPQRCARCSRELRRARAPERPGVPLRRRDALAARGRRPRRCRPTTAGWRCMIYASLAGPARRRRARGLRARRGCRWACS